MTMPQLIKLFYHVNYFIVIDAIDSNKILAAREAVILLISKSGVYSTISIPTIPVEIAIFIRYIRSMLDKPLGEGTETPGANAGSRQSKSIEIYRLPLLFLFLMEFAIFNNPRSAKSIGVIISIPDLLALYNSSGSAGLIPNIRLLSKSIYSIESLTTEP